MTKSSANVKFVSEVPFTFTVTVSRLNLQYSFDGVYWFDIDGSCSVECDDGTIMLRGCGVSKDTDTSGKYTLFDTDGAVDLKCSGNLEALIDYKAVSAGHHPEMPEFAFANMFCLCDELVDASGLILPSNLSNYCLFNAFRNCTSLKKPPVFVATDLYVGCYMGMFENCISLVDVPSIPIAEEIDNCYKNMFYGCSSLVA